MLRQGSIPSNKGLGLGDDHRQWNLLREDVSLPAAVLLADNVEHNLRWMQNFIDKYRVKLAPHGKTTMSPALFRKQVDHGAWGITLATVQQVQVAHSFGIRRIIMANQLVGRTNMTMIRQLLDNDPDFDFYCLIDSASNVERLGQAFSGSTRRLQVLLEIGVDQGRTGIRHEADEGAILATLAQHQGALALAGVELYEGVLLEEAGVRQMLQRAVDCLHRLMHADCLSRSPPIITGAGSAWYDVVAEEFSRVHAGVDIVLRPGCYLTHDVGIYQNAQARILARNPVAREISGNDALRPALQIWAYVQSIPEPTRAIMAFGKRDAAFDAGYPTPVLHHRVGWPQPRPIDSKDYQIRTMMDQHAFMSCPTDHVLRVGDMIAFDISHPCLTFDKWRKVLLVDTNYTVVDVLETYF